MHKFQFTYLLRRNSGKIQKTRRTKYEVQSTVFADGDEAVGTGAEVSATIAEQTETVGNAVEVSETDTSNTGDSEQVEQPTEAQAPSRDFDRDAIYADARRRAEAEAKKRQESIDAEYVRRFGNYKNPITGEPIRSQADYLAALDAQEQARVEKQMRDSGVDAKILQQFIDNNPVVKQAKEYMQKQQQADAMKQIEADVAELGTIDPSIKSFENIPRDVVEFATNKHLSLTESYKILNYGKMTQQSVDAARQSAVNQIKGKQHMAPMNGVASNNTEVEIPVADRGLWEAIFPNKTYAERRTLYNRQLK